MLNLEMHIMLHHEKGEGVDQNLHGFAVRGCHGHDVDHGCIITVEKEVLAC